jgi:hypothetical protein
MLAQRGFCRSGGQTLARPDHGPQQALVHATQSRRLVRWRCGQHLGQRQIWKLCRKPAQGGVKIGLSGQCGRYRGGACHVFSPFDACVACRLGQGQSLKRRKAATV